MIHYQACRGIRGQNVLSGRLRLVVNYPLQHLHKYDLWLATTFSSDLVTYCENKLGSRSIRVISVCFRYFLQRARQKTKSVLERGVS